MFHFIYVQHVSDLNTSIIRRLRLFYCITTLVVCSCFDVCRGFGVAGLCDTRVAGCLPHGYHPNKPHRNSNTHRNKNTQPMWWYNRKVASSWCSPFIQPLVSNISCVSLFSYLIVTWYYWSQLIVNSVVVLFTENLTWNRYQNNSSGTPHLVHNIRTKVLQCERFQWNSLNFPIYSPPGFHNLYFEERSLGGRELRKIT